MDAAANPFAPGAGTQPPELAGRGALIDRATLLFARILKGRAEKSMLMVGLRGAGKTVLLNRIREIGAERGFEAALIEAPEGKSLAELLTPHLRRALLQLSPKAKANAKVRQALGVLRGFASAFKVKVGDFEFGVDPAKGIADTGDLDNDLSELLCAIGEVAAAQKRGVALIIDEMQYIGEPDFASLIMAMHRISQRNLPIVLAGAGLPQLVWLAGRAKSYAERLFDFPEIGALNPLDSAEAIAAPMFREGVSLRPEAIHGIVSVTRGYPYFLQEWGYQVWNMAQQSPITRGDVDRATTAAINRLDANFFRVRFDRLTPSEKSYLRAMASLGAGPHRSGDIAAKLGKHVRTVAPIRSRLISKGMIFSPTHGDTAFTAPMFDEFMRRIMPER